MTSRRIFLRAAIVMGASSFDGSRVMIECGHRTRVGTAIEVDLNPPAPAKTRPWVDRSEEHTSELQSLMSISYAVFSLKNKKRQTELVTHLNNTSDTHTTT